MEHRLADRGFTALDLLFAVGLAAALTATAVPIATAGVDEMRTTAAARYLAGRIVAARLDAVRRSAFVGLRFETGEGGVLIAEYRDGNGNGIRAADIAAGVDGALGVRERLSDRFAGVRFGLAGGVPDLDGGRSSDESDGIRFGVSRILSLGPDGTASSGTLYVRGARGQFAVRVLGATGRVRILQYQPGVGAWKAR